MLSPRTHYLHASPPELDTQPRSNSSSIRPRSSASPAINPACVSVLSAPLETPRVGSVPIELAPTVPRSRYSVFADKALLDGNIRGPPAPLEARPLTGAPPSVQVLQGCSFSFIDALAVHLKEAFFAPSQVIFQQEEIARELYILQVRAAPSA